MLHRPAFGGPWDPAHSRLRAAPFGRARPTPGPRSMPRSPTVRTAQMGKPAFLRAAAAWSATSGSAATSIDLDELRRPRSSSMSRPKVSPASTSAVSTLFSEPTALWTTSSVQVLWLTRRESWRCSLSITLQKVALARKTLDLQPASRLMVGQKPLRARLARFCDLTRPASQAAFASSVTRWGWLRDRKAARFSNADWGFTLRSTFARCSSSGPCQKDEKTVEWLHFVCQNCPSAR